MAGVGTPVSLTGSAAIPSRETIGGTSITLAPLSEDHAAELFSVMGGDENAKLWDYVPDGPFGAADADAFQTSIAQKSRSTDPFFWAAIDNKTGKAIGFMALMRIDPANRVVEIGHVMLSPLLQRTTAATEAYYLLASAAFDKYGYRRFEWKCNDLNEASKRAALRLGFTYEGTFRQHMIVKGRNRDTAWFSIIDSEWPHLKESLEKWLDPTNFDQNGNQNARLQDIQRN